MKGKIAIEEHFAIEATLTDSTRIFPDQEFAKYIAESIVDFHGYRLEQMDRYGIELSIVSLNAPAIQAIKETAKAIETAKIANEVLAEECAKNPKRFAGFAALPMQDPDAATKELIHCVKDYGFKGGFVNGSTENPAEDNTLFYDLPQYWDFWAEVEKLDVPLYIHPRSPHVSQQKGYEGHPWLRGSVWGFTAEVAINALRLMSSGLFDKYSRLNIILGHFGETLPVNIWRTSHCLTVGGLGCPAKRAFSEYLSNNFYVTTSGNFRMAPLLTAMIEMGSDRIIFATDYPFEKTQLAADWFDTVEIGDSEREKIGRLNAIKLFKLDI